MMKRFLVPAAALALLAATSPASARDYPKGGVTGEEILSDLKDLGQDGELTKDSTGDPLIRSTLKFGTATIHYQIYFFGCQGGRCTSIQYHLAFTGKPEGAAEWNAKKRFARMYVDDKTLHLEYDVDVEQGANTLAIQNTVSRFASLVKAAADYAS